MRYLLDTNVVSEARRPRPDERVLRWLDARPLTSTYLSVITLGELEEGVAALCTILRAEALRAWLVGFTDSFGGRHFLARPHPLPSRAAPPHINRTLPAGLPEGIEHDAQKVALGSALKALMSV